MEEYRKILPTWDDNGKNPGKRYFAQSEEKFNKTHKPDDYTREILDRTKYNWKTYSRFKQSVMHEYPGLIAEDGSLTDPEVHLIPDCIFTIRRTDDIIISGSI